MTELKFLEIMGNIGDDLLKEADVDIEKNYIAKPAVSKRRIYAVGSVAAAAVIAVGSAVFFSAHSPSELLGGDMLVQSGHNEGDSSGGGHGKIPDRGSDFNSADTSNPAESRDVNATFAETTPAVMSTDPSAENDGDTAQNTKPPEQDHKGGVTVENCYFQPFTATIDPNVDSYGADEIHHIDVRTADGFYRQLAFDEYAANGISGTISISDLGGYIGRIAEVNDYSYHGNGAESQEPSIAGADVYYYAPAGNNKMFIIVKKGDQCSMFVADEVDVSSGFRNGLAFFDVQSADDIRTIEYHIDVPDDSGRMVTSVQKTITDTETISAFYELLCQLQPEDYSSLPAYVGTPQWLVDARENYSSAPTSAREDIGITIMLTDGGVLQDIIYQPYLGNGYVEGMQELTPEQNTALRKLIG